MRCEADYWAGYIAGLIDGEGSLWIWKHKTPRAKRGYCWDIGLVISNTNLALLEKVQSVFCGRIRQVKCNKPEQRFGRRPMYQLFFNRSEIRMILSEVDLILKSEQQGLVLEALDILKGSGNDLSDVEQTLMEDIYLRYSKLGTKQRLGDNEV